MWQVRAGDEHEYETVSVSGEDAFFLAVDGGLVFLDASHVVEVCDVCETPGSVPDPLAHFRDPAELGGYVIAHGDCGDVNGLELA